MELAPSRPSWEGGGCRSAISSSMQLSWITGESGGLNGVGSSWVFNIDWSMDWVHNAHSRITWADQLTLLPHPLLSQVKIGLITVSILLELPEELVK